MCVWAGHINGLINIFLDLIKVSIGRLCVVWATVTSRFTVIVLVISMNMKCH